jgi:hypothetical protein
MQSLWEKVENSWKFSYNGAEKLDNILITVGFFSILREGQILICRWGDKSEFEWLVASD